MNRTGHENTVFFIGPEVEHTPAYSKKTLFVVGKPKLDQIESLAKEYKTPHIFLGANHSFNVSSEDPYWNLVITALLDKGYWVTLDYQAHEHETVLKMLSAGVWQSRLFVPLLGVRIPNVQTSSLNLTIKIDDVDFNATNPGVWCLHHHEITDSNRFTDWQEYGSDAVVAPMSGPVPTPVHKVPVQKVVEIRDTMSSVPPGVLSAEGEVTIDPNPSETNPSELGLDLDPVVTPAEVVSASLTPNDAADAYAEGATEDVLAKDPVKKVKAKK